MCEKEKIKQINQTFCESFILVTLKLSYLVILNQLLTLLRLSLKYYYKGI